MTEGSALKTCNGILSRSAKSRAKRYIGLEYPVALDLHLYFYSFRDVVSWAIANGFKWYRGTALNYDLALAAKLQTA